MKAKLQKVSYYVILALLAICFVFTGASLIVNADDNSSSNTQTIKYVSLGDSMTNGYGLNGYANNGLMIETPSAYPARFAKYLSQVKNAEVDLVQLAVAAQRPEDISFFLEIDLNDQEAVDIANRTKNEWIAKYGDTEWKNGLINEWNAKFKNGDFYTWTEQTDGRLKGFPEGATERERLVNALRTYQESVRDADVISLCEGNANFGVFLLNKLLTVLGGGTSFFNSDWEWVNIQDAVRSLDAETQSLILSLNDELTTLLAEQMPDNPQLVKDVTKLLSYTVTSYVISYKNLLDQIVTYNPDVEIMVVGIINSFYGTKIAYEQDGQKQILDIGEIFELIFGTLNYYQTSVPTIMQLSGNPLYKDVKFLYAEPTQDVELLVTQLSRSYDLTTKTWKDVDDVDSLTLRDRNTRQFNHNIFGLIKGLINPLISDYGLQLEEINLQDVLAYEQFIAKWQAHLQDETNPEPKPTDVYTVKKLVGTTYQDVQTTLSLNKIITTSIFLAIDDVSVYASTLTELDASAFLSIATGGLNDGLFSGVASALDPNALIDMNVISADVQNAVLSDAATYTAVKQYIISTYDDLIRPQVEQWATEFYLANGTMPTAEEQEQAYLGFALSNNDIVNDVMFNPNYGLKFVQQYLSYYLANNIYSPLNQALKQDATLVGLFSLYSRFMVGDGLGVHPSKYGHDTILNSIISSYENGYTCKDAVIDKTLMVVDSVATVIKEHGNEILNSAYDYLDTNGYIDQFNGYVAQAEQMLQELQLSLNQTIDSYVTLAKEQVDLALKDIKAQIETIKPMAEKLGGDIEKKVNEIIAFVDQLENDIINGINSVLTQAEDISLAIKEYSSLVSTRLQNFVVMVEEKVAIVSEQIALEIHNLSASLQVKINDAITYSKNLIANATSQDTINKIKADLDKFLTDAKQDFYLAVTNLVNDYKQELATFVEQVKQEQIKFIKETVLIIKTSVSNIVAEISSEISLAVKDFAYTLTQDAKAFVLEISNSVEKEIANLYKTFVDRLVNVIGTSEEAILTATEYVLSQLESIYTFADSVIGNLDGVLQEIATTLCNQISYIAYNVNLQVATTINTLYNNIKPMVLASVDKIATSLEQVDFAQIKQDLLSLVTSVELELNNSLQALFDTYSAKLAEFIQVVQQEQIAIVSQALQSVKVFAEQAFAEITTLLGNEIKVVLEQIGLQLTSCLVLVKNLALDTANSCYNSILANLSNLKDFKQDLLNTITNVQANLTVELQNLYAKYTALYQDILSSIQQTQNELFIFVFTQIKQTGEYILTELQTTLTEQLNAVYCLVETTLENALQDIIAERNELVKNGSTISYEIHPTNSYYLSLGDGSTLPDTNSTEPTYGEKLATSLGLNLATQYKSLGVKGMRIEDLRYMIDSSYIPDQYSLAEYSSIVSISRNVFIREIRKADLITVGFETTGLLTYTLTQALGASMGQYYQMDWTRYFGENADLIVSEILNGVTSILVEEEYLPAETAPVVKVAIEAFIYSYIGYVANVAPTIDKIHEINPNAKVILVGLDRLEATGMTITLGDTEIDFADLFNVVIDSTNFSNLLYSASNDNACFVEISSEVNSDAIADQVFANIQVSSHQHDYNLTEWEKDANGHYHACACGDKIDQADHDYIWVVDKVAYPNKNGAKHQECSVCGYANGVTEVIPKLNAESNKLLPLFISLSCLAIAAAGVGIFFFFKKKF